MVSSVERAADLAEWRAVAGDYRGYVQARNRFQRRARGGIAARLAEKLREYQAETVFP